MDTTTWQRAQQIFDEAIKKPASERAAFVSEACAGDRELREQVEKLLRAHEAAGDFLASPTVAPPAEPVASEECEGARIGPYKLLQRIGEGGFATVYMAEQTEPVVRKVALKIVKLGMDTRQVIARFEAEEQALAMMDHPNIARVFDAGTTDSGRPYFVMELVRGEPINEYCDQNNLPARERLELLLQVCHAVQHAHQKSIIHRDLKPSNVLVTRHDAAPLPKVIDFGIAKALHRRLTDKTLFTDFRQFMGTPAYMSPEQAELSGIDIDTRSDVYSLGVLAYELLTGQTPFDMGTLREAPYDELRHIICEVEPPTPSKRVGSSVMESQAPARAGTGSSAIDIARLRRTDPPSLSRLLRGDLDWIVMKCLEKDRTRRYDTVNGLATDIEHHLRDEPVLAGPPSAAYKLRKFVRRNKGLVTAVGAVVATLVLGLMLATIGFTQATRERDRAIDAEQLAELRLAETEKARDNLKTVAGFQSSMLSGIDAERLGRGIFADLRDGIREALETRKASAEEIDQALAFFDASLAGVNATNLALKVIDEQVLARAVETITKRFADQPLIEARLRATIGRTYRALGDYNSAEPQLERALDIRRRLLGEEHQDTLYSMHCVGSLYMDQGRYDEAEPLFLQLLEIQKRVLGDDHRNTLDSMNSVGLLYAGQGRYDQAEPYHREALEGKRRVLGDDHGGTRISILNMGTLLKDMGKFAEAEPYLREALERGRRGGGDDSPSTLASINNMGHLLKSMGKLAEAEPYFREALEGARRVLGDDHPNTLNSIHSMGDLLKSMGKLTEAEPYYREALAGRRRVLGDDHLNTLISIGDVGELLRSMGKLAEAEPYFREALEARRRVLGDDHPTTLISINDMGTLLMWMGRPAEAEPYVREALEGLRRVLGDDSRSTLNSINNMGSLLESMGKPSEAEPYFHEALEGKRRVLGDDHTDTLMSAHNMGALLRDLGRLEEAEPLGAEAVRGARAKLAPSHPFRLAALAQHGLTLAGMQRFAEAEAELLEAHEGFVETRGHDYRRTKNAAEGLADLYTAWHAAEPDQGYDAKAAEWRAKLPEASSQPATSQPS